VSMSADNKVALAPQIAHQVRADADESRRAGCLIRDAALGYVGHECVHRQFENARENSESVLAKSRLKFNNERVACSCLCPAPLCDVVRRRSPTVTLRVS
jgi:hypothetical protein